MSAQSKWFFTALKPGPNNWLIWTSSLILLAGLFYGNWNPLIVVFGYFVETIVVGFIHVAKMAAVLKWGRAQRNAVFTGNNNAFSGVFGIVFFMLHYFFFIFVQSVFVFSFFGQKEFGFDDAFHVFKNYYLLLQRSDMQLVLGIIMATQLGSAVMYFFLPRKFDVYTMEQLFLQPYLRIIVQQFAAIFTGFIMLLLGGPLAAALVLIVVRLILDSALIAAKHNEALRLALYKGLAQKNEPGAEENAKKLLDVWLDN